MALLTKVRGAQHPLVAEFVFNYNDTMKDTAGVEKTFGSVYTDAGTFEIIPLPVGAIITGGELIVETQGVGPTAYTAAIATASQTVGGTTYGSTTLLSATSLLSSSGTRTALTGLGTGANVAGNNVRVTIASTVANATAGKFRVRVEYTIEGRAHEALGANA